jgi:tRNA threonylcarbamoyladenosine biosynthesis protein TsaB
MLILNIETSGEKCSVAVSEGARVIYERCSEASLSHATLLGGYIEEALRECGIAVGSHSCGNNSENVVNERNSRSIDRGVGKALDAVSISAGPGSYTGLRIGCSMAKGLCFGMQKPLIAVPTLYVLAWKAVSALSPPPEALLCPMLDARRMEVYTALYDARLNIVRETEAVVLSEDSFSSELATGRPVYFFGAGAAKYQPLVQASNAVFASVDVSASDMAVAACEAYLEARFEDVAYYEPFYLKEFMATKPKRTAVGL